MKTLAIASATDVEAIYSFLYRLNFVGRHDQKLLNIVYAVVLQKIDLPGKPVDDDVVFALRPRPNHVACPDAFKALTLCKDLDTSAQFDEYPLNVPSLVRTAILFSPRHGMLSPLANSYS